FQRFLYFRKSFRGSQRSRGKRQCRHAGRNENVFGKGRTNSDRRHNFVMSTIWDLKYYNGSASVLRHVLNGWGVSTIIKARSGALFTVTSGRDNNLDGNNNDRADLIGNPQLSPNRSRAEVTAAWFNTAMFQQNAAGQPGTAGRNILDKPGMT